MVSAALALFCLPHIGQDTIDHEDLRFRAYLAEHGYDTSMMGIKGQMMRDSESPSPERESAEVAKVG